MNKIEIPPIEPICLDCLPVGEKVREFIKKTDPLVHDTCIICKQEKDDCRMTREIELYSMKHILITDDVE